MFCTECGTQVDEGKNFCRNCGARLGRSAPSEAADAPPAVAGEETAFARAQPTIPAAPHAASTAPIKEGKSNKVVLLAAGIAVIVLAGAGVFFAGGLFDSKPAPSLTLPPVQEPMAKAPADVVPLPSFEASKEPPPGETPSASVSPPFPAEPPVAAEAPKAAPAENTRKGMPADPVLGTTKSQGPRASQDPAKSRPLPASRGGANPGTYETVRGTTVYEDPSASAKVLANIPAGVRVNVVGSTGDWLEVHSKRGNPPGFIRRGDATFVEAGN